MSSEGMQSYQLFIKVAKPLTVLVGKLGRFEFPSGDYVYTGSAKKNIEARVRRHLSKEKKLRWHIDYLLAASAVSIERVELSSEVECRLNQALQGDVIAPKFGASDCRSGCGSHLKLLRT